MTAQQELRWPAEDPDGAAGAIIDRIAEALRIDGNTGGGPEMPPIVERRSSRQLVVRFDLTDQLRGDAAGSDAAFRYSWTATPGTGAVVILARSEYVGTIDLQDLRCEEQSMYENLASIVVMGLMMAPK